MHTVSYEFLMKPEESAECHQTLSSRVGSGHESNNAAWVQSCHIPNRTDNTLLHQQAADMTDNKWRKRTYWVQDMFW